MGRTRAPPLLMPFIDPHADIREAQVAAALPVGQSGVVIDGRLHPFASIGSRIAATVIDLIAYRIGLLFVLMLCAWVITLVSLGSASDTDASLPGIAICAVYIVASFGPFTYRRGGQSLGKGIVGIRVVQEDGSRASLRTLMLRETPWRALPLLLIPIQATPTIFDAALAGAGIVFALLATADPQRRTFYDRLAHTVVVEEDPVRPPR